MKCQSTIPVVNFLKEIRIRPTSLPPSPTFLRLLLLCLFLPWNFTDISYTIQRIGTQVSEVIKFSALSSVIVNPGENKAWYHQAHESWEQKRCCWASPSSLRPELDLSWTSSTAGNNFSQKRRGAISTKLHSMSIIILASNRCVQTSSFDVLYTFISIWDACPCNK